MSNFRHNQLAKIYMYKLIVLLSALVLWAANACGQVLLSDINREFTQSQKVFKYVQTFESPDCIYFSDLEASVDDNFPRDSYSYCVDTYEVDAPIEKIWQTCLFANPSKIWCGKRIKLSFIYNNIKDKLTSTSELDDYQLETEQIYFINLKVLKGFYHLPTALKVSKIDADSKSIVFKYLKGGKSEGQQELSFVEDENGKTKIIHRTHFKSNSRIRDKRIYPFFHHRIVRDIHQNIEKLTNTL